MQNKNKEVVTGVSSDKSRLTFSFELKVKKTKDGQPNFTGQFAHGSVKERFLYLTTKAQLESGAWHIIRRIKVHLRSIQWEQVEAVLANPNAYLEAQVDGRGTASVPLLGDGWTVQIPSN